MLAFSFVCLFVCLSVCWFISVCLFICLFVCLLEMTETERHEGNRGLRPVLTSVGVIVLGITILATVPQLQGRSQVKQSSWGPQEWNG